MRHKVDRHVANEVCAGVILSRCAEQGNPPSVGFPASIIICVPDYIRMAMWICMHTFVFILWFMYVCDMRVCVCVIHVSNRSG